MAIDLERITDEEYFDKLKGTFATEGWQVFLAELTNNSTYINSVESTEDSEDLWFRKGQLAVISNILNLEQTTELAEKDSKEVPVDESTD